MNQQLMSEQIDQLATALAKAQSEFDIADKNQKNAFFKSSYADFESIVKASRPALAKHGLSVVQVPFVIDPNGSSCLISILMHTSGQWIKSVAEYKPVKNDIQSLSSYNTYLKRMCYTSLVGVVVVEEDDDGERATIRSQPTQTYQPRQEVSTTLEDYQTDELSAVLDGYPEVADRITEHFKIDSISQIPRRLFSQVLTNVRAEIETKTKKNQMTL